MHASDMQAGRWTGCRWLRSGPLTRTGREVVELSRNVHLLWLNELRAEGTGAYAPCIRRCDVSRYWQPLKKRSAASETRVIFLISLHIAHLLCMHEVMRGFLEM